MTSDAMFRSKNEPNYEANGTHSRLSLSSPEKAPFMSSIVQEISLFFRSLKQKSNVTYTNTMYSMKK